jgi:hypothetical protein
MRLTRERAGCLSLPAAWISTLSRETTIACSTRLSTRGWLNNLSDALNGQATPCLHQHRLLPEASRKSGFP